MRAAYPQIESVLDIGCGIGSFVDWAGRSGLRAIGSDVDPKAVAEARERGLDVHVGDELAENVAAESVDMVTLWDVIEHVYEPRELLASALVHLLYQPLDRTMRTARINNKLIMVGRKPA